MRTLFLSSAILLSSCLVIAQPLRYQRSIFDSVTINKDIQYGEADFYDANSAHNLAPLLLDFYHPFGDTLTKRPLVITIFGGAFLGGTKDWSDMIAWCDSLSRFGYACASIQYRLLYNPLEEKSIIRASYRAVQDTRAAIRFLVEHADDYGIDTTKIFLLGNSAGSITALLTAFMTHDSERPTASYGFGTTSDADDLGCLDCSGNNLAHHVTLAGIISLWGGVWDINIIEGNENIPSLLVHGTADDRVPCDTGRAFGISFTPFVYGSIPIANRMGALAIPHEFYPFDTLKHAFYMDNEGFSFPNQYWDTVFTLGHNFLYKVVTGTFTNVGADIKESDLLVYPNPANGFLSIHVSIENVRNADAWLTNIQGAKLQTWRLSSTETLLDVSAIPQGVYLLSVQTGKEIRVKKVVIW